MKEIKDTEQGYAILELGTGYMDGWYYKSLDEVIEIARYLDEVRPQYIHKVIAKVETFPMREPVICLSKIILEGNNS